MPDTVIPWKTLTPNQRDALVAEHIFDRNVVEWRKDRALLLERIGQPVQHESVPAYTESMDEAWKVLQMMAEAGHDQGIDFMAKLYGQQEISILYPTELSRLSFMAKLTPAMICIAAPRSLGLIIEIEEGQSSDSIP